MATEAARIIEATRTPMEAHLARVNELDKLLSKGYLTQTVYNRALSESQSELISASAALNQFSQQAEEASSPLSKVAELMENRFSSAVDSVMNGTMSIGKAFKGMLAGMAQDAAKLFMNNAIQTLFGGGSGGGGLYGGGGGGFLSGLLGGLSGLLPGFASGADRVPNDMVARIHKDEMIIPAAGANAIRNGGLSGSQPQTIHIVLQPTDEFTARTRQEVNTGMGQAVRVSVLESGKQTRKNFGTLASENNLRKGY
jgi:hypothetical protein